MCPFFCYTLQELLGHVFMRHRSESNFSACCNFPGCDASYKNYPSFKRHVYTKHQQDMSAHVDGDIETVDEEVCAEQPPGIFSDIHMKYSEAAFLLSLRAHHNLSSNAVTEIIDAVKVLYQERMKYVKQQLKSVFCGCVDVDSLNIINADDMFIGLDL
jgi:hypothetical protein